VYDFPDSELAERETDLGDFTLTPPSLIVGRVLDPEERPVQDVEVSLRGSNGDRYRLGHGQDIGGHYVSTRETHTDADGRFAFGDLAAGQYTIQLRKLGWAEPGPRMVLVQEGSDPDELVLRMGAGAAIRGRVVDETGGPVREVRVSARQLSTDGGSSSAATRTDSDGAFELRGVAPGEYSLDLYPFWISDWDPEAPWLSTRIEGIRTGIDDLEIVMEKGSPVRGQLLDASGTPLFGYAIQPAGGVPTTGALVTTYLEGHFELAVPRNTVVDLEVRGPGERRFGPLLHTETGIPSGAVDVVIQLSE